MAHSSRVQSLEIEGQCKERKTDLLSKVCFPHFISFRYVLYLNECACHKMMTTCHCFLKYPVFMLTVFLSLSAFCGSALSCESQFQICCSLLTKASDIGNGRVKQRLKNRVSPPSAERCSFICSRQRRAVQY